MSENRETTLILAVFAVIIGLALVATASMTVMGGGMMGRGGMTGGGGAGFNLGGILIIIVLLVLFILVMAILLRRTGTVETAYTPPLAPAYVPLSSIPPSAVVAVQPGQPQAMPDHSAESRRQEIASVKLLDEDERNLYVTIRERGGEMLQKDIVASGSYSKAKVTRLLDKLERKGLVVRERHGMTNRIKLTMMPPKAS